MQSQPTGMQPQQTGYGMMPQMTGYNPQMGMGYMPQQGQQGQQNNPYGYRQVDGESKTESESV